MTSPNFPRSENRTDKKLKNGLFISFEGGEGSGKSTQIQYLAENLRKQGFAVILTREPGGTAGAEALRHILLNARTAHYESLHEAVLFAAARRDHIENVIAPALIAGNIVLCDRFMDSTRVYQGLAQNIHSADIEFLEEIAVMPYKPALSIFLNIDAEVGMKRAVKRRGSQQPADRFEKDSLRIQKLRQQAFLEIARNEPLRCRIVEADRAPEIIAAEIWNIVKPYLTVPQSQ